MEDTALVAKIPAPIPLAWLATLDGPAPGSLPDAVGDSYLCAHNPLFAGLRNAALNMGFRFSAQDTPLWRDYDFLPLTTIDRILEGRTIPYADNWTCLRRLLDSDPKAKMPVHMLVTQLRHNHTLHEASHGVAHTVLRGFETELRSLSASAPHAQVVQSILEECFANTVEITAADSLHMPLVDEVFYALNSYMAPPEKGVQMLRLAAEKWGAARRFAIYLAAYFESNLTTGDHSPEAVARVAETAGVEGGPCDLLTRIVKAAFRLSRGFREDTTPFYFERRGLGKEYRSLLDSAWLGHRDRRRFIGMFVNTVQTLFQNSSASERRT